MVVKGRRAVIAAAPSMGYEWRQSPEKEKVVKGFELGATYDKCIPFGVSGTVHLWQSSAPDPDETCNCGCYSWEELQSELERYKRFAPFWPTERQAELARQHNERIRRLRERKDREHAAYVAARKEHWKTHCPACDGPRHGMAYTHVYNLEVCRSCIVRIKKEYDDPFSMHHYRYSP